MSPKAIVRSIFPDAYLFRPPGKALVRPFRVVPSEDGADPIGLAETEEGAWVAALEWIRRTCLENAT